MKIKIYRIKPGNWAIRISGRNNRVLLDAAGYNSKRNAVKSLRAVLSYAAAENYKIA